MPLSKIDANMIQGGGTIAGDLTINGNFSSNNITNFGYITNSGGLSSCGTTYFSNGARIIGDVVITGALSASGGASFANTIFTTTSSLSVVNTGAGPALYVSQGQGNGDIASFYDGDGVEALHIGNAKYTGGQNVDGVIGIMTSFPNKTLTVVGDISATGIIYGNGCSLTNVPRATCDLPENGNLYFTMSRGTSAACTLASSSTPQNITASTVSSPGSLFDYSRADHSHQVVSLSAGVAVTSLVENISLPAGAPSSPITLAAGTNAVYYYTTNTTANFSINVTNVANLLTSAGQTLTVIFMHTNGATAYGLNTSNPFAIDGTNQAVLWQTGTGSNPIATANAIDSYTFTIIKKSSGYTVLGSLSYFK